MCATTWASERFSVFTKSWLIMSDGMVLIAFLRMKPGPQFRTAMSRLSSSHNRRNVLLLGRPKNMPRAGLSERSMTRDDIFAFGHSLRCFIALGLHSFFSSSSPPYISRHTLQYSWYRTTGVGAGILVVIRSSSSQHRRGYVCSKYWQYCSRTCRRFWQGFVEP
jgi:hypothetical protein